MKRKRAYVPHPHMPYPRGMELLGWSLVILAVLLVTGLLGPILGVVLAIAALPALAVLGVMLFPLLLVLLVLGLVLWVVGSAIGVAAGLLGFLLQWGLPLLLLLLGIWLLTRRGRPPGVRALLPGGGARPEGNLPR